MAGRMVGLMVNGSGLGRWFAAVWGLVLPSVRWSLRTRLGLAVVGLAATVVPVLMLGGVAAAACPVTTTTAGTHATVVCNATTTAKTSVLKYIGVALVGVVVVLALMIGVHVLIRLFHRVTGR